MKRNCMNLFQFRIKPFMDMDQCWKELENAGAQLLFSTEASDESKEIFGFLPEDTFSEEFLKKVDCVLSIDIAPLLETNWQAQWEMHGVNYHDGCIHVSVKDFDHEGNVDPESPIIKLEPGPGFGDLSHPTTNQVVELMCKYAVEKNVLDVGCGSGILSLCAVAMGAESVAGIDIDPEALVHSQRNAAINTMEHCIRFCTPEEWARKPVAQPLIVVMNMIRSEQEQAWKSLKASHSQIKMCLTSGVLVDERSDYLEQTKQWGWTLVEETQKENWLGFCFNNRTDFAL